VDYLKRKGADLNNFNASSLAIRALLDVLRQTAQVAPQGVTNLKTSMTRHLRELDRGDGDKSAIYDLSPRARLSWANFRARGKWLKLYAGPFDIYMAFVEGLIRSNMNVTGRDNWTHYTYEEQLLHYRRTYIRHKEKQINAICLRGEALIKVTEDLLRQIDLEESEEG